MDIKLLNTVDPSPEIVDIALNAVIDSLPSTKVAVLKCAGRFGIGRKGEGWETYDSPKRARITPDIPDRKHIWAYGDHPVTLAATGLVVVPAGGIKSVRQVRLLHANVKENLTEQDIDEFLKLVILKGFDPEALGLTREKLRAYKKDVECNRIQFQCLKKRDPPPGTAPHPVFVHVDWSSMYVRVSEKDGVERQVEAPLKGWNDNPFED